MERESLLRFVTQKLPIDRALRAAFIHIPQSEHSQSLERKRQTTPFTRAQGIEDKLSTAITLSQFLLDFIPENVKKSLQRHTSSPKEVDSVSAYQDYLTSSLHYALELHMYDQMVRDMTRRVESEPLAEQKERNIDPQIAANNLLKAHTEFFYGWFAKDDIGDNSLFRGRQVAYHELHSPHIATTIYETTKRNFIAASLEFGDRSTQRLIPALEILDGYINSDSSQNYYKFGNYDTKSMFDQLHVKASAMIDVSINTSFAITGSEINPELREASIASTEAMWIANDLKDITQPKTQGWYELRSGRISLPTALMLHMLPDVSSSDLLSTTQARNLISTVWEAYRGFLTDSRLTPEEKIAEMTKLENMPNIANAFSQLKRMLLESGALNVLWGEITSRMNYAKAIKQKYPDAYFLRLYCLAVDYYLTEKRIKVLLNYPESACGL